MKVVLQLNKEFEPYRHCSRSTMAMFIQQLTMQEHSGLWKVVREKHIFIKDKKTKVKGAIHYVFTLSKITQLFRARNI